MKKTPLFLLILGISLSLPAQNQKQNGVVRLMNSGKQALPEVTVQFSDAVPTTSGTDGKFTLVFQETQPGEVLSPSKICKTGYELINEKEVYSQKLGDAPNPPIVILMAEFGFLINKKAEYYNISLQALT